MPKRVTKSTFGQRQTSGREQRAGKRAGSVIKAKSLWDRIMKERRDGPHPDLQGGGA